MSVFSFKAFFLNKEEGTEKLRLLLIMFYAFALPYNLFFSSVVFITLALVTLIDLNRTKLTRIPKQFWLFQAVYFLGILAYAYSLHKDKAGFLLERQLTIFLFPLILPLAININSEKIRLILSALAISCVIAVIYLFCSMIFTIHTTLKLPVLHTAVSGAFFNHAFSKPIGIHAGYLSLYVSLSFIYLISLVRGYKSYIIKVMLILASTVLFFGLVFLASRNTIISTFLVLVFIFPVYFIRKKRSYVIIALSCLLLVFIVLQNVPYFKERFSIELISDLRPLNNGKFINYSATEPRIERWKCAVELIKESPLIGYGTGDEIDLLKTKYATKGLFISYIESFNAHNQYLSILIKNGIVGLILFLMIFFYYAKLAVKKSDFLYISFLVLLFIGFYTENILDANKGIVFFALFNTLFGYNCLNENQSNKGLANLS